MFIKLAEERYRVLMQTSEGAWVISFDLPKNPSFLSSYHLDRAYRIEPPKEYIEALECNMTVARQKRLTLIQPLLEDEDNICNSTYRQQNIKKIAKENHTTVERVQRIYFLYLAKGTLIKAKPKKENSLNAVFDFAIKNYYFSAKQMSLKDAYNLMLMTNFTDANNQLAEEYPSWYMFRNYFYRHCFHKNIQKHIKRNGLSNYLRNHRKLSGCSMIWRNKIGSYQMDATIADIYLVSRIDKSQIVGRPYIYLAVDTATSLIAGVYVGFEAGENSVMACLANAAEDKVAYCQKYGITITKEQWASHGIPSEIITDKGKDFIGQRIDDFCMQFGAERIALEPFRPDEKGCVEKTFDLLQKKYKPLLRGKGVIEEDAQERWSVDYREQAVLDLTAFTKIIIHCILHLNNGRILNNLNFLQDRTITTPSGLWLKYETEGNSSLLETDNSSVYIITLPRKNIKLTQKGFSHLGLFYIPTERKKLIIGNTYSVGYDTQDISYIYVFIKGTFIKCALSEKNNRFAGISQDELIQEQTIIKREKKKKEREAIQSNILLNQQINDIVKHSQTIAKTKDKNQDIKQNREDEKKYYE